MLKHFRFSLIFTLVCLILAGVWGFSHGVNAGLEMMLKVLFITIVLAVMEVSLSFDNAVVNASVLKHWDEFWKKLFLTVGVLIAVFGMRLVFPIVIVAVTANMGFFQVIDMAIDSPAEYSARLKAHHAEISAFGGMFLLLVFLNFLFDAEKDTHWFKWIETKFSKLANIQSITVFIAICVMVLATSMVPETHQLKVALACAWGLIVYLGVQVLCELLAKDDDEAEGTEKSNASEIPKGVVKAGIGGFLYLEVLDASFSFDGVIGAFAITSDVVIIMLGLAIGAMFVRSMTIYLVDNGTLDAYKYLEHGAHYAIGALAVIMMLAVIDVHVPEVFTGLIGVAFIVWAIFASIKEKKKEALQESVSE